MGNYAPAIILLEILTKVLYTDKEEGSVKMLEKKEAREIANRYTDKVLQFYQPKQIIIFGSYVDGSPHAESDIDIAVIFDNMEGDWLETWSQLIGLREGISFDIETHMLDETCNRSGFLDHIRNTGEVIYQSA